MTSSTLFWFRQDLRLADNPGLLAAAEAGTVIPIYILEETSEGEAHLGAASRWWLHHSLEKLSTALDHTLNLYKGRPEEVLLKLLDENPHIQRVYWNRCYEPWRIQQDTQLKLLLKSRSIEVKSFNASLLWEPWEILKKDGTPYQVFTPFYRKGCLGTHAPRPPLEIPPHLMLKKDAESLPLRALDLLPHINWDTGLAAVWDVGEEAAHKRLADFLETGIVSYKEKRNYPAEPHVSRLSPHLHFGEISPHQVWTAALENPPSDPQDLDHFLSELGWREFSFYMLYHFPDLPFKNFQRKFDGFPWKEDPERLQAWQRGQTGVPLVDAGMRQLWQTGYMHNRVRMVVASFLVKNLGIHWQQGAAWFWDCLVDADLANNSAGWQWVAGSGADAAPYFRIFNPVSQGEKFDPAGAYIRQFVPELARLPNAYLFSPWEAPPLLLKEAGVVLGETYPWPIVNLAESRAQALAAYKSLSLLSS